MILQMNPPTAARALMNDLTRPLKHQLPYIKKVHGGAWVRLSLANITSESQHNTNILFCFVFFFFLGSEERGLAKTCKRLRDTMM
jgi:hypothetical protein